MVYIILKNIMPIFLQDTKLNKWILPIIQGFIQSETCHMEPLYDAVGIPDIPVRTLF